MQSFDVEKDYMPKNEKVFALSYSSGSTLQTCEYKYACTKMYNTQPDVDSVQDYSAFRWGKACHKVMEDTEWNILNFDYTVFEDALLQEGFLRVLPSGKLGADDSQVVCAIYAACMSLFQLAKKQKLKTVKCEFEIKLPYLYGFIDAICTDNAGGWWIRDLKTSGRIMEGELSARLSRDRQLNLYALPDVLNLIEEELGLSPDDFLGVRYTVVSKTTIKDKTGESPKVYASRVTPKVLDFEVPREMLHPEGALDEQMKLVKKGLELRNKVREPNRNLGSASCYSYSRPCEYWSQCYGGLTVTEIKEKSICYNLDNVKDLSRKTKSTKTKTNKATEVETLTTDDLEDVGESNFEELF